MLTVEDVVPTAEVGQYWASLKPLYLFKVQFIDVAQWQFTVETWIVGGTPGEPNFYIGYDLFLQSRHLHEASHLIDPEDLGIKGTLRTGDVVAFKKGGALAFVVVEGRYVRLYSDWVISEDPAALNHLRLFQRGPENKNPEPTTRFERVLEDQCP